MKQKVLLAAAVVLFGGAIAAGPALAQSNIDKMRGFKVTGTSLDIPMVPQDRAYIAQLRKNLEQVKLPPGFKIDVFAVVPDARHMAVSKSIGVVFTGTRKSLAWAITDRNRDRIADEVKVLAPSISMKVPNGMCITNDGILYVVEHNRALILPAAEFFYESPDVAIDGIIEPLVPVEEESFNHGARTCSIGPDNKLYITLGQPFNVPAKEKRELYKEWGIGGIIRMNRDGTGREVYVDGVRNSVGHAWNPANGELWFTDNQVDGMGDHQPPGELNRVTDKGQNFGFPWYGGGDTRTTLYADEEPPADIIFPEVFTIAHAADLGMMFYTGTQFPEKYRGGIFSAQHGSWNRTTPVGARVMFTSLNEDGSANEMVPFAHGWLVEESGEYLGRPVDVEQYIDGSILVSDDLAGAIYRISYDGS
jgi:glucose/arabinose dehydrogenase